MVRDSDDDFFLNTRDESQRRDSRDELECGRRQVNVDCAFEPFGDVETSVRLIRVPSRISPSRRPASNLTIVSSRFTTRSGAPPCEAMRYLTPSEISAKRLR